MVPLGATQIFANEINPTQVEERNLDIDEDYDIDDNLEDVDENEELARQYGIMSVPTFLLFKDGKLIDKRIGYIPKEELDHIIKNA